MVMRNFQTENVRRTKSEPAHTIICGRCRTCDALQVFTVLTCEFRNFLSPKRFDVDRIFPTLTVEEKDLLTKGVCGECTKADERQLEEGLGA